MQLKKIDGTYAVVQLAADASLPDWFDGPGLSHSVLTKPGLSHRSYRRSLPRILGFSSYARLTANISFARHQILQRRKISFWRKDIVLLNETISFAPPPPRETQGVP